MENNIIPKCLTFKQVLANSYDQVLVRELLNEYVPEVNKKNIVNEFNRIIINRESSNFE